MDPKILEELTKAVAQELRNKERASAEAVYNDRKVKAVGISTGFLTPYEVVKMSGGWEHPDPFYAPWAEILSKLAARHICGPVVEGVYLTKDRAPICEFDDIPSTGCLYNCGPILVLKTDIGDLTAPPCHGADHPGCAGRTAFPDLCTMIKAGGCKPIDPYAQWYLYAVSVLDFSTRDYNLNEVKLMVDDLPLAIYSFGYNPERKRSEEILYLYMTIAFPYDFIGVEPPPGAN
jgi:hypothetical protein